MQDRVPLYPGRVTLTPVSGQANTYDMVRADSPTQEGTALNEANLLKDTTAALYGLGTDAVPDEVLSKLSRSVLAEVSGKYTKHTTEKMSEYTVGDIVQVVVGGKLTDFIVVHQGKPSSLYDDSCNGTWLLMKDVYENRAWHSSNSNSYKASTIHSYLNSTFLNLFDANIKAQIKTVKIPYVNGTANSAVASGSSGLSAQIFLPSGYEVGWTTSDDSDFPVDGAKLDYFTASSAGNSKRIAYLSGNADSWWLRSPYTYYASDVWLVNAGGYSDHNSCSNSYGVRPAFILPADCTLTWYTDASGNVYTEQEVETQLVDVLGNLISIPAEQIKDGVKIATGSYTGTGKYGSGNKNTLTFGFQPKLVFVEINSNTGYQMTAIRGTDYANSYVGNGTYYANVSWGQNTVTWYSAIDAGRQLNASSFTYYYLAIG